MTNAFELHDIRVRYMVRAIGPLLSKSSLTLRNSQIGFAADALYSIGGQIRMRNCLVHDSTLFYRPSSVTTNLAAENLTVHNMPMGNFAGVTFSLTNCLLIKAAIATNYVGSNIQTNSSDSGIFQTVGSGSHYLATNGYRNAGTTNIDATLLAELLQRTTYPPVLLTNKITNTTVLAPTVSRDTDTPDLGYHYDAIDYLTPGVLVTNSSALVLTNGVCVGVDFSSAPYGIKLESGSQFISEGSPTNFNRLVRTHCVQEVTPTTSGSNGVPTLATATSSATGMIARLRFTDLPMMAGPYYHFLDVTNQGLLEALALRDSSVRGGIIYVSPSQPAQRINWTNTLFERVSATIYEYTNMTAYGFNNLFKNGSLTFSGSAGTNWVFKDNLFDKTTISENISASISNDWNGYITNFSRFNTPYGSHDQILVASPIYDTNYYLPTSSPLINAGSRTADAAGLWWYTTTTNQVAETNSTVDIGLHYIALNASGVPGDFDSDTIPDYQEDVNGNGMADAGETDPRNPDTDYDGRSDSQELADGTNPLVPDPPSNPRLWLRADVGVTTNGSGYLSLWADQSGNAYNGTQTSGPNQPLWLANAVNGHATIRFDATSQTYLGFSTNLFFGVTQAEVFVVLKATADVPSTSRAVWSVGTQAGFYPDTDGNIQDSFGSTSSAKFGDLNQALDQYHIYSVASKAGEWTARLNGTIACTTNGNTVSFPSTYQFLLGQYAPYYFSGDIAEILMYDRALTPDERHYAGRYLAVRFALTPNPANPTNLTATAISSNQVSLSWTATLTNSVTRFFIERKTGSGGTYALIAVVEDATSYLDSGLAANTQFFYRVKALNYAGESAYCDEANATTLNGLTMMPVADLNLWLKSDAGHGLNYISLWLDQSGKGNHAIQLIPNSRSRAVQGSFDKPVIRFDGTNFFAFQSNPFSGTTQAEAFVVVKAAADVASPNNRPLWDFGPNGNGCLYPDTQGKIQDDFGRGTALAFSDLDEPLDQYHIYNVTSKAGEWTARLNGVIAYATNINTASFSSAPHLGYNGLHYFSGDIAELLVYSRVLSSFERESVTRYLDARYAAVIPTVTVTNPVAGSALAAGPNYSIGARAVASGGSITQVVFYANDVFVGTDTSNPYSSVWSYPWPGTYMLTARAWDNTGNSQMSAPVAVTIMIDSDGDGISDLDEILNGTDPFDANSPGTGPSSDPSDHTGPVITLRQPAFATPLP